MNQQELENAYATVAERHPDVTDKRTLELLTRRHLMSRKRRQAGILFLGGMLLAFITSYLSASVEFPTVISLPVSLLGIIGGLAVIIGVCQFVKALHDPLTPDEARELAFADAVEKGGNVPADITEVDDTAYINYEEERYRKASLPQKFLILVKRLPPIVGLLILVLLISGLGFTISGTHNLLTYEERNAHAISVPATVINIEKQYDSDAEEMEYTYTYQYTYNGQAYTTTERTFDVRGMGSSTLVLIDSQHPENIIVNNGKTTLTTGLILLAVGLFLAIYSLTRVRKANSPFSLFGLLWILFAAAAVGFAVWGISMLIAGDASGLLILLLGCPVMLMGAFLFRALIR